MRQRETTTEQSIRSWLWSCAASERETFARLWGLPLPDADRESAADDLVAAALTPAMVAHMLATLTPPERAALDRVLAEGGTLPAAILEREYGAVRLPAEYANPRTFLLNLPEPPTTTERLFILGLILPSQQGRMRVYTIPVDLRPLLPTVPPPDRTLHLSPASDPPIVIPADLAALEQNILTILVLAQAGDLIVVPGRGINKASLLRLAKRWGMSKDDLRGITYEQHWRYVHFLRLLLQGAGLLRITAEQELRPTSLVTDWLQASQLERRRRLLEGWVQSEWDELKRFLGIEIKGYAFERDLTATHRAITDILARVPPNTWITWEALLDEVLRVMPDFARPSGVYDTWRLVDYRGQSLDGFEHWRDVEGELLKATIGGSLRWLGLIDYGGVPQAENAEYSEPVAFRLTALGAALLNVGPAPSEPDYEPLVVQATYDIIVPPRAAPFDRFQVERVAKWVSGTDSDEAAVYRLTKASVQQAVAQGIDSDAIIRRLEQATAVELPQNVVYSLREWSEQHGQLTLSQAALLRADDPLLLEQVRRDRRLRMPPVEELDTQTWLLDENDAVALAEALRKAGYGLAGAVNPATGPALKERDLTVLAVALKFYIRACAELQIDHDASAAMLRRFERLLNERRRTTADQLVSAALTALHEALKRRR
jgi:hypothetical protein